MYDFREHLHRLAREDWVLESRGGPKVGQVVKFKNGPRRYVVIARDQFGHYSVAALSGTSRGSNPTGVKPDEIQVVDEPVVFKGKKASWLLDRARRYMYQHHKMGGSTFANMQAAADWTTE